MITSPSIVVRGIDRLAQRYWYSHGEHPTVLFLGHVEQRVLRDHLLSMGPITRTSGLTCARATYDGMEIYVVDAETFGAVGVLDPEIKEAVGK